MVSRLTTNQEIAGSRPVSVKFFDNTPSKSTFAPCLTPNQYVLDSPSTGPWVSLFHCYISYYFAPHCSYYSHSTGDWSTFPIVCLWYIYILSTSRTLHQTFALVVPFWGMFAYLQCIVAILIITVDLLLSIDISALSPTICYRPSAPHGHHHYHHLTRHCPPFSFQILIGSLVPCSHLSIQEPSEPDLERLTTAMKSKIRDFIDHTFPGELVPYKPLLPDAAEIAGLDTERKALVCYQRFPIVGAVPKEETFK